MGLGMKHQGEKIQNILLKDTAKSIEIRDLKIIEGGFSLTFNPFFSKNHDILYVERENRERENHI